MKKYKPYLKRVDLVKNQVKREKLREEQAKRKRKQRIREQNRRSHLRYQEQLAMELASRYSNSMISVGGDDAVSFSNTKSLEFDGTDDYVTMGNQSSLDFEQTDAFSISAWVKRNSTGNFHAIASKQDYNFNVMGTNSPGYSLFFNDDDTVRFLLAYIISTHRYIDIKTTNTITDTNWHHIVLTYDGTGGSNAKNGVEIYIDGTQQTVSRSGNLGAAVTTLTSAPFNIGARDDQNVFMDGKIDEVAVFNTELSASDVTNIYNGSGPGKPGDLTSLSPVSWWRFEEGSGTTATDSGTGGNDGTLVNGTTYSTDIPS